jgi:IstB-like ATP binding protein
VTRWHELQVLSFSLASRTCIRQGATLFRSVDLDLPLRAPAQPLDTSDYEKRSVAVSSNLHPSAFDELMPKTLATATVDRLMHHAHVCQTAGDSIRLSQALAGPA